MILYLQLDFMVIKLYNKGVNKEINFSIFYKSELWQKKAVQYLKYFFRA